MSAAHSGSGVRIGTKDRMRLSWGLIQTQRVPSSTAMTQSASMRPDKERTVSLEEVLTYAAGLSRVCHREKILDGFWALSKIKENSYALDDVVVNAPTSLTLDNSIDLLRWVNSLDLGSCIIASSYFGHPVAFSCAASNIGIPITLLYQNISDEYRDALLACGIELIPILLESSASEISRSLDKSLTSRRLPVILFDAPVTGRRTFSFLGYKVTASTLLAQYAARRKVTVHPVFSIIGSDGQLFYQICQRLAVEGLGHTELLLTLLEERIRSSPEQYKWTSSSLIYTDADARLNALSFLESAISWREKSGESR